MYVNLMLGELLYLEGVINCELEFQKYVPFNIDNIIKAGNHVMEIAKDPVFSIVDAPEDQKAAFWELFDELMDRDIVVEHDTIGKHGCKNKTIIEEEELFPF